MVYTSFVLCTIASIRGKKKNHRDFKFKIKLVFAVLNMSGKNRAKTEIASFELKTKSEFLHG